MNNLFDKKITARILSILLAIMLWLYVITEQNPVIYKDLSIPVKLINIEALSKNSLMLLDKEPYYASLKLRGNKNTLDRLNKNTVTAACDIKEVKSKGSIELPIEISGIPVGVDISWVSSSTIKLNVDNIISKTMLISVKVTGNPLQGMAAMIPIINPEEVTIKGAESLVNTIASAEVQVDISSSNDEVKQKLPVRLFDSKGNEVEDLDFSPKQVDIIIPIENTKRVMIEADYAIKAATGYILTDISISPKEIYIAGKKDILDSISKVKTERIEIEEAKTFVEKEVVLLLPDGVELANKSEKVLFSANIEKIIEKPIETNKIGIRNISDNLEADIQLININALAKGAESLVNAWDVDNAFYVDLKDLGEGIYNIQLLYDKPEQLEIRELYPNQITAILRKKE